MFNGLNEESDDFIVQWNVTLSVQWDDIGKGDLFKVVRW